MAVDDPVEDVGQIGERLDVIELGGFDQRSNRRPMLRSSVRTCKEGVLAVEGDWPDRPLNGVGVDLDASVIDKSGQSIPA